MKDKNISRNVKRYNSAPVRKLYDMLIPTVEIENECNIQVFVSIKFGAYAIV